MLWLIGRVAAGAPWSDERRPLVLAACACARLARPSDPDSLRCLDLHERWARGEDINQRLLRDAAYAADGGASVAAAAFAARAADDAAHAAHYAAARYAAVSAAALSDCADIVRHYYPEPPPLPAAEEVTP